jgi:hypothetical protein
VSDVRVQHARAQRNASNEHTARARKRASQLEMPKCLTKLIILKKYISNSRANKNKLELSDPLHVSAPAQNVTRYVIICPRPTQLLPTNMREIKHHGRKNKMRVTFQFKLYGLHN